ncbi:MAG: hypothetical protein FWE49_02745 [Synergistaceae bacterium]|nr:hypothetical protein [Synergistaceae bacterium]
MVLIVSSDSAEKQAIEESKNFADWLERAFIKSNITKQRFLIKRFKTYSPNFYITWMSDSSETETYDSGGRALFSDPSSGNENSEYNPLVNYLEHQLGMTINVYDRRRSKLVRYVIVSRFGRVRVSTP